MLPSLLSLLVTVVRRGVAFASRFEAGLRSRTGLRAVRTSGRIWSRMIGVVCAARMIDAFICGRLRTNGRRLLKVGPRILARGAVLFRALWAVFRVPGSSATARCTLASWLAIAPSAAFEE